MNDLSILMAEISKQMVEKDNLVNAIKAQRCLRCGKKLSDDISKFRGYGPVCWERLVVERQEKLF